MVLETRPLTILEKRTKSESNSESEDEYELPLRPREDYKDSRILKRTLSGPITKVSDENRVCLIQNEAIVGFDQLGTGRRPREGCVVDLVQERYTSPSGLDQGWRNVYCYLYPLPIDSNGTLQIKYIKFIDFDRQLIILDDSELICELESAQLSKQQITNNSNISYTPNVGDLIRIPNQEYSKNNIVRNISPAELVNCTGTINFWDRKRQCGRLTGSLGFNISNCNGFEPRTNDEVTYSQIKTRKGHRAIHLEKLTGAAQGKKRPNVQRSDNTGRRFIMKGVRPKVELRRETPPSFLLNYDVPLDVDKTIRSGGDLLAIMPDLVTPLTIENYQSKFRSLLYCEEVAMAIEHQMYSLQNITLEQLGGNVYTIPVPGLKNESPRLVLGDRIILETSGERGKNSLEEYHAFVHSIRKETDVVVEMHETFKKIGQWPVNVHFTMNRYPIRNHQCVISKAGFTKTIKSNPIPESILFPSENNYQPTIPDHRKFTWKIELQETLENIRHLNRYQSEAIRQVLSGGGLQHPMVIFGPAGTGKTRTLVELVRLILTHSSAQILVAAPSNAAADILAERISRNSENTSICRWNALRRLDKAIPEAIRTISNDNLVKSSRCVITTCLAAANLPHRRFDFCLIDEAGQSTEPDILIPISKDKDLHFF